MRLPKQNQIINFSGGTDSKTDPFQLQLGAFTYLQNTIFTTQGLLAKRNGYKELAALPQFENISLLTQFNQGPIAVGNQITSYSSGANTWFTRGNMIPLSLSTTNLIQNGVSQIQVDVSVASNGLCCAVYAEQDSSNPVNSLFKYAIFDSQTGQCFQQPTLLSSVGAHSPDPVAGTPRVFVLNNFFVILYIGPGTATAWNLNLVAISTYFPTQVSQSYTLASNVSSTSQTGNSIFDGVILNNILYVAWNSVALDGVTAAGICMNSINSSLVKNTQVYLDQTHTGVSSLSLAADLQNQIVYVSYAIGTFGEVGPTYALGVNAIMSLVLNPTQILAGSGPSVANLASFAQNGLLVVIIELPVAAGYFNELVYITCSQSGTVAGPNALINNLCLASKAFLLGGNSYFLGQSGGISSFQPTYFLMQFGVDGAVVIGKLSYSNAGGFINTTPAPNEIGNPLISPISTVLPSVNINGNSISFGYLFKDFIQSVNKTIGVTSIGGTYSQSGIALASFSFTSSSLVGVETGKNLNLNGGITWAYDGVNLVEQGFHLFPDDVSAEYVANQVETPTGNVTSNSITISSISSMLNIHAGMSISGTGIPSGTIVVTINPSAFSLTMSNAATASNSGVTLTIQGNVAAKPDGTTNTNAYFYQVTYEWADNQGNIFRSAPSIPVPVTTSGSGTNGYIRITTNTLTLTYKTNVKIVIYRWSVAQQNTFQVTSLQYPFLNDPTQDALTYTDCLSDAQILGNPLIYTTGGVLENIGPPAFDSLFTFDNRLWGIDSENKNLLWQSEEVLQNTPVNFSDLLTYFVAPSLGAQGSTGPLTCGAALDDKAILFKQSAIYYVNGTGPDATGANSQYSQPIFVTSTVGCSNAKSIVFMPQGLMFEFKSEAGNQIWLLGRDLSTQFIGASVFGFTKNATVQAVINIPGTNQVRFTLSSGVKLSYDYYYNKWSEFTHCAAISSVVYNDLELYINAQGQALLETPGAYLDNGGSPVLMSFQTGWVNLAGLQGYMRSYYFFLLGTYLSPHKIQVGISTDFNSSIQQSYTIQPLNSPLQYGNTGVYGNGTYGGTTNIEQFRNNFQHQRCQSFQLTVQEIYDSSFGIAPGAGFTLSGINYVYGVKKGYPKLGASQSVG